MQLVYDFLYKRYSPTFFIFLCTGHSDYSRLQKRSEKSGAWRPKKKPQTQPI
jgi:hypothetical protein